MHTWKRWRKTVLATWATKKYLAAAALTGLLARVRHLEFLGSKINVLVAAHSF